MEIHQLLYFHTIAKMKSYRQAAEHLHVSQPALTKAIQKLEAELAVSLFIRTGRTIDLSVYGQAFLPYVTQSLQSLMAGKEQLQMMRNPTSGKIRLAFLQSLGTTLLPTILRRFNKHYPHIIFDLVQCSSKEALDLLNEGHIDLCLNTNFSQSFDSDNWVPIKREQLYVYCARHHELAAYHSLPLHAFANYDFVCFKQQLMMQQQILKWCRQAGFTPHVVFEGTDVPTIAGLISANLGIGILPYYSGLEALPVHKIEIEAIDCTREVGLAWRRGASLTAPAQLFVDFTAATLKNKTDEHLS
jgi:LysR family transcriptional regulator, transcription activator of glutamate synthase operon